MKSGRYFRIGAFLILWGPLFSFSKPRVIEDVSFPSEPSVPVNKAEPRGKYQNLILSFDFEYQGVPLTVHAVVPSSFVYVKFPKEEQELAHSILRSSLSGSNRLLADAFLKNKEQWVVDFYEGKQLFGSGSQAMRDSLLKKESAREGRSGMVVITPRGEPDNVLGTFRVDTLIDRESPIESESLFPFEIRLKGKIAPVYRGRLRIDHVERPSFKLDKGQGEMKVMKIAVQEPEKRDSYHRNQYSSEWEWRNAGGEIKSVINNSKTNEFRNVDIFGLNFLFAEAFGISRYSGEKGPSNPGKSNFFRGASIDHYWLECDVNAEAWDKGDRGIVGYYEKEWGFAVNGRPVRNPDIPENYSFVMHATRGTVKSRMTEFFRKRVAAKDLLELKQIEVPSTIQCEKILRAIRR